MRGWKSSVVLLVVFLWGSAPGLVHGQDAASQLRMLAEAINQAKTQVRYEAEQTVYAFSPSRTTVTRFRVQYAFPYRKRECIEGPERSRFVLLEDGKYLWSYFPARKIVVKKPLREGESPFPLSPTKDLNLLMKNYEIAIRGPVPAGGMQCRFVEFIPKQGDRPRREFWLEERWNVPIRVRVASGDGRPAYMAELQSILWDPGFDPDTLGLKVPQDTKVYEVREKENLTMEEARSLLKQPLLLPRMIPEGYTPQNIVFRMEGLRNCLQIIYTDGLSSFSFFQEWTHPGASAPKVGLRSTPDGSSSISYTRQYGLLNVVTLPGSGPRKIIVGDIHEDRLIEIGESLHQGTPPP